MYLFPLPKLQFKRLTQDAVIPSQAKKGDAGYDLTNIEPVYTLTPGERKIFKTGLIMAIPQGSYGRIAPRSGLAAKNGIDVLAGVIDCNYRGEVGVVLINLGQTSVEIAQYQKIAQVIIEKCFEVEFQEVTAFSSTERGENGFGSTDKPQS